MRLMRLLGLMLVGLGRWIGMIPWKLRVYSEKKRWQKTEEFLNASMKASGLSRRDRKRAFREVERSGGAWSAELLAAIAERGKARSGNAKCKVQSAKCKVTKSGLTTKSTEKTQRAQSESKEQRAKIKEVGLTTESTEKTQRNTERTGNPRGAGSSPAAAALEEAARLNPGMLEYERLAEKEEKDAD